MNALARGHRLSDGFYAFHPFGEPAGLPIFPTHRLPDWVREVVIDQANAMQVAPGLPGLVGLGVLSAAFMDRFGVQIRDGWVRPCNLFVNIVTESGGGKSPVFNFMLEPFFGAERRAAAVHKAAEPARQARALKRKAAINQASGVGGHLEDLVRSLTEPGEMEETGPRKWVIGDITGPNVPMLLERHGPMTWASSEGEVLHGILGTTGGASEPSFILKAYDGEPLRVDRVSRPSVSLDRPLLTVISACQPSVWEEAWSAPQRLEERGFFARFCIARLPKLPGKLMGDMTSLNPSVGARYYAVLARLLDHERAPANGSMLPKLRFEGEAQDLLYGYMDIVTEKMRPGGELAHMPHWGEKHRPRHAVIAALLHAGKHAGVDVPLVIETDAVLGAGHVCAYLEAHALYDYDVRHDDGQPSLAEAIWPSVLGLIEKFGTTLSQTQIGRGVRSVLRRGGDLKGAMKELERRGYLRTLTPAAPAKGRPATFYEVSVAAMQAAGIEIPQPSPDEIPF